MHLKLTQVTGNRHRLRIKLRHGHKHMAWAMLAGTLKENIGVSLEGTGRVGRRLVLFDGLQVKGSDHATSLALGRRWHR